MGGGGSLHFLLSPPIERRSKHRIAVPPFAAGGDLSSAAAEWWWWWWCRWAAAGDGRLLPLPLDTHRPARFCSPPSPFEDVPRLDGVAAAAAVGIFAELLFLDMVRVLSESTTASVDEPKESARLLCLELSPRRPEPGFLLAKASTAPVNLSRISCPTEVLSGRSTEGPIPIILPLCC